MAEIFISWSSADAAFVNPLATRLVQEGFTVDEYSTDPRGGDILRNVGRYVDDAVIALFCLSINSVQSEWVRAEYTLCASRNRKAGFPEIVPVLIGDVPTERLPGELRNEPWLRRLFLPAAPGEAEIVKLLGTVSATLEKPRYIIPAALISMTDKEARLWLEQPETQELLEPLCKAVGMAWGDEVKSQLLLRYGPTAADFKPFGDMTIKEAVQKCLLVANEERLGQSSKRQLGIWWCTDEIVDPKSPDFKRASELWQNGSSIVIVDSISVLKEDIYDKIFKELPEPNFAAASALLWVPPYTLHTVALEQFTEAALRRLGRLLQKFNRWGTENSRPYIAFDIGTRPTLRRWLHEAFSNAETELQANADALAIMKAQPGGQNKLNGFFRQY